MCSISTGEDDLSIRVRDQTAQPPLEACISGDSVVVRQAPFRVDGF